MAGEHISLKLQLDKGEFERALGGVKAALGGFKNVLAALGIGSMGALFLKLGRDSLEFAEQIKNQSEALGVSTDFLQRFTIGAEQNGSSSERATKALDIFTRTLAEHGKVGVDVEREIRDLADKMAATPDPVTRAKLAFDAFGKSGAELIPILAGGASGFDLLTGSIDRLSDPQIKKLDELKTKFEQLSNTLKIDFGSAALDAAEAGRAIGNTLKIWLANPGMSLGQAAQRNLMRSMREAERAQNKSQAQEESKKAAQEKAAFNAEADKNIENLLTAEKEIAQEDKESLRLKKEQAAAVEDIFEASEKVRKSEADAAQEKKDRSGLTLQDLAGARAFTFQGRRNIFLAQRAQGAEEFAKQARIEGRDDLAEKATNFALDIRKRLGALTGSEQDPLRGALLEQIETRKALQKLLEKFSDGSATVTAQTGN